MYVPFSFLIISSYYALTCHGFSSRPNIKPTIIKGRKQDTFLLKSSSKENENPNNSEAIGRLKARTCIKNLLTQRSVQSFMFLQEQCRDPHTVDWIEKFTNTSNLLQFHGTGGFNLLRFDKWNIFFLDMMESGCDKVIITVKKRGRGIGGWSPNNPYLKVGYKPKINPYLQDRTVEYTVDIDPPSLASRILAVREQIANEFARDLEIIADNGDKVIESYFENRAKERDIEKENKEQIRLGPDNDNDEFNNCNDNIDEGAVRKTPKFDRDTMRMLINLTSNQAYAFSPLRVGNFDLLLLLATQESIHRVVQMLREEGPDSEATFRWFRSFYVQRASMFFDGNGKYGRHDDFLDELLSCSPTLKKDGKKVTIVDPIGIAEMIILTRTDVAHEWKHLMMNVQLDHMDLRRTLLDRQLEDVEPLMDDDDDYTANHMHIEEIDSSTLFSNSTGMSEFE